MADLLTETLAKEGAEPGQEGMLTPQQMIEREQGKASPETPTPAPEGTGTPAPVAPAPEAPKATEAPKEVNRDDVIKKVEANQDLTDDEKAELILIQKEMEAEPPPPEQTFNIAGKVYTATEIDSKMREEWIGQLDLSPERLAKVREGYVKAQNREAQHLQVQKQQEVNAAERQAVLQAKLMLEQDLNRKKMDRERLRKEAEMMKARAAVEVNENDLYDETTGRLKLDKQYIYNRKQEATERLPFLQEELASTEHDLEAATQELFKAEINALTIVAPQYKMPVDVITAWKQMGTLSPDDKLKVLELDELVRAARSKGIALEDEYAYRKAAGTLAIKPPAQPVARSTPRLPELPNNTEALRKAIAAYKKKAAAAPPNTAGAPGPTRPGGEEKSLARQMVEHGRAVLGTGSDDFLEKELGYGSR